MAKVLREDFSEMICKQAQKIRRHELTALVS